MRGSGNRTQSPALPQQQDAHLVALFLVGFRITILPRGVLLRSIHRLLVFVFLSQPVDELPFIWGHSRDTETRLFQHL